MGGRTRSELGAGALVLAAVAVYAVSTREVLDSVVYVAALTGAAAAAWVAATRAPAEHRLVARLVAAGITLTAVGDAIWEVLDALGRPTDVSAADAAWFASYCVLVAALLVVLVRSHDGRGPALGHLTDGATVVVVSVLVFWSTWVDPIAVDPTLAPHVRIVWSAYPVADAVLLALVVRVLMSPRARTALHPSFAAGVCLWLAADVVYLQTPSGRVELLLDVAWMVAPALMALSVWRLATTPPPSAPPEGAPRTSQRGRVGQLVIAIGPLLVPPALELLNDLRGQPDRPVLLMVGATALTVLAFVRMSLLMRSEAAAHGELTLARDAALEASRAKSMFLATMSHEIRTPLTMVLGAGEMLEDTELDDLQLDLVRRMRRSGALLRTLVDDILDFSRIESGQLRLAATRFDLHALVEELADAHRPRADAAGIRLDHTVDPDVPRAVVGDPHRLLQVLSNLVDNAVKFTHDGGVRVDVGCAAGEPGTVEVVVTDTGIGIHEEDLTSVFESFRQVDGSTTRRYGGTGLGLAICTELTRLMGGSLTVTSQPGAGSVFRVRVPLPSVAAAAAVSTGAPTTALTTAPPAALPAAPPREAVPERTPASG